MTVLIDYYGVSEQRIIIFYTSDSLDLMSESDHWFSDSTFKSAPPIFNQIYTIIHLLKYNSVYQHCMHYCV